jgi:hypothetical protein
MAEFVNESQMPELRKQLKELLDLDEGLSDWEISFLENLNRWTGCFTVPQSETLEKISEKLL